jgi:pimeloyl-ACP methyl ester carboxylesterase
MPLQEYEIQFESITVHYWQGGQGFPLLMLHGSGPGASTLDNWRLVLDRLVERYHVLAVDLIGFDKSGRVIIRQRPPRLLSRGRSRELADTARPFLLAPEQERSIRRMRAVTVKSDFRPES